MVPVDPFLFLSLRFGISIDSLFIDEKIAYKSDS